ncbi:MAG: hypothetical protein ACFCAD_13130 [Pleurocapsa sp.]
MSNKDNFKLTKTGDIYINNRSLIDIVKEIELAGIRADYESYENKEDEDLNELLLVAGDYQPLPLWMIKFSSRYFLDEAKDFTGKFMAKPENIIRNKTTLLGCTCRIIECWYLLAKITLTENTVTWSDFQNFHRDWWQYNLSFTFDRQQYEAGLIFDLNTIK